MKDFGPSVRINKSANSPVSKDSQEKKESFFGKDPQVNPEQPLGKLEDELEFKWGRVVTTRVRYTIGYHFWTSLTTQTKEMLCPSNQLTNNALSQLPVN